MSKYYNIKWKQSDNEDLKKAVKNFNAKITRIEKKIDKQISQATDSKTILELNQKKNALPDRTSVKQMRELIDTRQDLKRELNALRRFSKRGAEEIVTIPNTDYSIKTTKWQKNEMSRRTAIINRKRKERYEEFYSLPAMDGDKKLGYTVGARRQAVAMGKIDEISLMPLNAFTPKMTNTDLKEKFKTIMNESQSTFWNAKEMALKQRYINSIEENFNIDDITDIVNAIDDMDFSEFYKIFEQQGGNFELNYPPNAEQYDAYLSKLKSIWLPKSKPA